MNKINSLKIEHTYVSTIISSTGYTNNDTINGTFIGSNITLYEILYDLTDKWKDKLIQIQEMEYHSKEQSKAKKLMPRYYICGMFDMNNYNLRFPIYDYPKFASNLMTIDIDAKDNLNVDIWKLRDEIFKLPYVYSTLKSVSGQGFYCIIPIKDTRYTKEYYHYIVKLWKQKFDINIDQNADSIIRARIISWDENRDKYIKKDTDIDIWDLKYIESKKEDKPIQKDKEYSKFIQKNEYKNKLDWNDILHFAMKKKIADGYTVDSYKAWYHLGCELANFDDGYDLFYQSSINYDSNQSETKILKRWKGCSPSGIDDNLIRKWCGMCKNTYGSNWMKIIQQ